MKNAFARWFALMPALAVLGLGCTAVIEGPPSSGDSTATGSGAEGSPAGGTDAEADSIDSIAETCDPSAAPATRFAPLARLTRREYESTVRDLTGVSYDVSALKPDSIVGLFYANVATPVTEAQVDDYRLAAETVAESATADLTQLVDCAPEDGESCAQSFIVSFGRRAFRRLLTDEEVDEYLEVYRVGIGRDGFRGGIRLVLTAMLQAPAFLYRVETSPRAAEGVTPLSPFEMAARLSYLLTGSTPDDELLAAAESGALSDPVTLSSEAARLLQGESAPAAVGEFHSEWLKLSDLVGLEKDQSVFPAFTAEVTQAMARETRDFVSYVLTQGDGRFGSLLTAPYSVIEPALGPIYGVAVPAGGGRVDFDPAQRSGLLTQGAFLSTKAHSNQTSPVRRGVAFLQSVLCIELPPPPPDAMVQAPESDPDATTRERFAAHSESAACKGCHAKIDPPGFAFETYDGIGAYRTSENGQVVETAVELAGIAPDVDGPYADLRSMLEHVAASDSARACYATQWFRYALKREPGGEDACSLKAMLTAFDSTDGGVRDLVLAIATSDAFRHGIREE